MPIFTGSSVIGWQFLGSGGLSERLLFLQIAAVPLPPSRKVGYMAVYHIHPLAPNPALPLFAQGASIWSNGVFLDQPVPRPGQRNDVWAYWREAGIDWVLSTRV
jgi:hypothetical protein